MFCFDIQVSREKRVKYLKTSGGPGLFWGLSILGRLGNLGRLGRLSKVSKLRRVNTYMIR